MNARPGWRPHSGLGEPPVRSEEVTASSEDPSEARISLRVYPALTRRAKKGKEKRACSTSRSALPGTTLDGTELYVMHRRATHSVRRPDFSFIDPAGDVIVWEHLGMLDRHDYRRAWDWKKEWYAKNGFRVAKNLFTTEDDERGGLDSAAVKRVAEQIRDLL